MQKHDDVLTGGDARWHDEEEEKEKEEKGPLSPHDTAAVVAAAAAPSARAPPPPSAQLSASDELPLFRYEYSAVHRRRIMVPANAEAARQLAAAQHADVYQARMREAALRRATHGAAVAAIGLSTQLQVSGCPLRALDGASAPGRHALRALVTWAATERAIDDARSPTSLLLAPALVAHRHLAAPTAHTLQQPVDACAGLTPAWRLSHVPAMYAPLAAVRPALVVLPHTEAAATRVACVMLYHLGVRSDMLDAVLSSTGAPGASYLLRVASLDVTAAGPSLHRTAASLCAPTHAVLCVPHHARQQVMSSVR
ncbi:hypothetical protein EON68_04640, partial [archaeon]